MDSFDINTKLANLFGRGPDNRPNFRVVWSTSQIEKRKGEVDIYYNEIFVRKEWGIHELPKYSMCKDRWVLERLIPLNNPELTEFIGYEPLFVFQDKDANYLPLAWRPIEVLLHSLFHPDIKSKSDYIDNENKLKQEEEDEIFEELNNTSPLATALKEGSAVTVGS